MNEARVYAPTGMLGSGFLENSMARAMEWEPHVIGCDAGSTDGGPDPLGSGKCMFPREAVKHEMRLMLRAARSRRIPSSWARLAPQGPTPTWPGPPRCCKRRPTMKGCTFDWP